MASNAIFNRVQIIFYSVLISIMSGVNRIRSYPVSEVNPVFQSAVMDLDKSPKIVDEAPVMTILDYLKYAQQAFSSLMVWIILGFATGFLVGLINFR